MDKEKKFEQAEYIVGIAVIIAALLISMTLYMSMSDLQKAIRGISLAPASPAQAASQTQNLPSTAELKANVEKYINTNLLSQGMTAEVLKIEPFDDYVYVATVSIKNNGQTQAAVAYVSKDGSTIIIGNAFRTNETVNTQASAQAAAPEVPKAAKPKAQAFIMAYCPYGLQFMKAYIPVLELLGNKTDLTLNFVYYAMHGQKELEGNSYLYCVQKNDKPKFTAYLRCFVDSGNYTTCLSTAGVDTAKTKLCVNELDKQYGIMALYNNQSTWLSGRYPIYPVEKALNEQFGVGGSPTFILNGVDASVGRSAEAIKTAICNSFSGTKPAECSTVLSTSEEAPGQGKVGIGATAGTTASAGAGCGS